MDRTTRGVPEVDYLATSRRPPFDSLPAPVRHAVGELAGSPVHTAAPPVGSGFGGAYAGLVILADGSTVFAKCAGPALPHVQQALRQEAALLPALAGLRCASRLRGWSVVEAGGSWQVLVLEAIDGQQPGRPWTAAEADAAHAVCVEVAGTPADVLDRLDLPTVRDEIAGTTGAIPTLRRVAEGSQTWPDGHAAVGGRDAAELVALATGVLDTLGGDALVHLDVRPDNLLREPDGRMRLVDWNWAVRGAPWVDLVSLWPLMHHHGVDVGRFSGSPLLDGVSADDIDAVLAWFVGFMLDDVDEPPPPGCTPALRAHALFFADTTLRLLAHRRGWDLAG